MGLLGENMTDPIYLNVEFYVNNYDEQDFVDALSLFCATRVDAFITSIEVSDGPET